MDRAKGYLSKMVLRAPIDGIVNMLPNFRSRFVRASSAAFQGRRPRLDRRRDRRDSGSFRNARRSQAGRGGSRQAEVGQSAQIRVDAIPDKEFTADLDWISPIAARHFTRRARREKTFPARATLKNLDPRLRPGMSATAEIIIESEPNALLIPARASFTQNGKPAVYVQKGQEFRHAPDRSRQAERRRT